MRAFFALPIAAVAAAACVTINVYFPAAAAEKAADRVIDEVWGKGAAPTPPSTPAPAPVSLQLPRITLDGVAVALLNALVPEAQAQGEANLDITSPETKALQAAMQARHGELLPFYASGAVGVASDGGVAVRDLNLVALPQRTAVKKLVADENADRAAL